MPSLIFVLIAPILSSSFSSSVLVQLVLWNYIRKCKTTLKIVKNICVCSYITDLAPPVRFELTTYRFIPPLSLRYAESSILGVQPSRLCLPTASALLKRLTDRSSEHQKNLGQFPKFVLAPPVRFELTTYRFIPPLSLRYAESSILGVQPSRLCLPTASALLKRLTDRSSEHQKNLGQFPKFVLAPPVRFELTTYRLTAECSTAELRRHLLNAVCILVYNKSFVKHF